MTELSQLLSQNTDTCMFGEATAQRLCHTLRSSKVNWKKLNCWKSVANSWWRQCKNGWTDRDAVWIEDSVGPKERRIRWDPVQIPMGRGNFVGKSIPRHLRRHPPVSCAKTAEPIEMPFGSRTRLGPRKHVLHGVMICMRVCRKTGSV